MIDGQDATKVWFKSDKLKFYEKRTKFRSLLGTEVRSNSFVQDMQILTVSLWDTTVCPVSITELTTRRIVEERFEK